MNAKLETLVTEKLLSPDAAAEVLGIAPKTLAVWRCSGRYALPFVKVGRLVRYRRADLEAFLARRTVAPNAN